MRIFGVLLLLIMMISFTRVPEAQAVEEGQLVKKDGKWEYYAGEDPGLKYLYLKGIITEEEYNKGLKSLEVKERVSKPNFNIDVNNGLNIRVGQKFMLKLRLLSQVRYSYSTFNEAWGTVGNSRNEEILGGQVEFRALDVRPIPVSLRFLVFASNLWGMPSIQTFATTSVWRWTRPHGIKREATDEPYFKTRLCLPGIFHG